MIEPTSDVLLPAHHNQDGALASAQIHAHSKQAMPFMHTRRKEVCVRVVSVPANVWRKRNEPRAVLAKDGLLIATTKMLPAMLQIALALG
jgi:hypothetical protein